jgi:hypothetical protein
MVEINMHMPACMHAWSVNFWLAFDFWFNHAFNFVQTAHEEYYYTMHLIKYQ